MVLVSLLSFNLATRQFLLILLLHSLNLCLEERHDLNLLV